MKSSDELKSKTEEAKNAFQYALSNLEKIKNNIKQDNNELDDNQKSQQATKRKRYDALRLTLFFNLAYLFEN